MARTFDGSTDTIVYGDISQLGNGSIATWFNPTNLPAAGDRDILSTFCDGGAEPYSTQDKNLFINSSGILKFRVFAAGIQIAASTTAAGTGAWYHGGMSLDGTNLRLWFNGVNEGTTASGSSYTGYGSPKVAMCGIVDGVNDGESGRTRFDGAMAEYAMWSVALDAGEWAALAKGYSPLLIRPASLTFYTPWINNTNNVKRPDAGTVTGTSTSVHPRVMYPRKRTAYSVTAAAPGGDAVPQVWSQYRRRHAG